ncbi:MAG: hypothetical protein RL297_6 [Pseudomonadota bacterium]|jgi:hypothetical protein
MNYLRNSSIAEEREQVDYEVIFGNDNGEDEDPEVLAGYFLEHQSFTRASDKNRRIEIVKARKGMGKSALLSHLKYRLIKPSNLIEQDPIVIKVTGNELIGLADFTGNDASKIENRWKQVICKRISMEIASQIGFAGSDDTMSLVEAAEIEGLKGKNLVTGLMNRIGKAVNIAALSATNGAVSLETSKPTDADRLGYEHILRRLQESKAKSVWLLIDDIDAKFVDTPELQTRIGAFFSAIRSLAFSVEGLRIRASVRPDVWTNLRGMEDQDKFRQYITEIKWSDDHLRRIFAKRILSYLQRNGSTEYAHWNEQTDYTRILAQVFSGQFRIGSETESDPLRVAMMLAGKRPRWLGQLCKQAGNAAGTYLIQQSHFNAVMGSFGQEKISDLIKEHQHQFKELQKVIDAFRGSEKSLTKFKLTSLLDKLFVKKLGNENIPSVNGFPFKSIDQLAEFLFEIDFIVGEKGGKHTQYQHDPTLFSSEQNAQNKVPWIVNLSYRKFLGIQ